MKESLFINMSDLPAKRKLLSELGRLNGPHEILIRPIKRTRSLDANRFYFAAVCTPFRDWLREAYGDNMISTEQAHEMLKVKILGLDERKIEGTDETITIIPRSKTMKDDEFSLYTEKCIQWLGDFCQIEVAPVELFYERPSPPRSKR